MVSPAIHVSFASDAIKRHPTQGKHLPYVKQMTSKSTLPSGFCKYLLSYQCSLARACYSVVALANFRERVQGQQLAVNMEWTRAEANETRLLSKELSCSVAPTLRNEGDDGSFHSPSAEVAWAET
jgi:hypothetical protein